MKKLRLTVELFLFIVFLSIILLLAGKSVNEKSASSPSRGKGLLTSKSYETYQKTKAKKERGEELNKYEKLLLQEAEPGRDVPVHSD